MYAIMAVLVPLFSSCFSWAPSAAHYAGPLCWHRLIPLASWDPSTHFHLEGRPGRLAQRLYLADSATFLWRDWCHLPQPQKWLPLDSILPWVDTLVSRFCTVHSRSCLRRARPVCFQHLPRSGRILLPNPVAGRLLFRGSYHHCSGRDLGRSSFVCLCFHHGLVPISFLSWFPLWFSSIPIVPSSRWSSSCTTPLASVSHVDGCGALSFLSSPAPDERHHFFVALFLHFSTTVEFLLLRGVCSREPRRRNVVRDRLDRRPSHFHDDASTHRARIQTRGNMKALDRVTSAAQAAGRYMAGQPGKGEEDGRTWTKGNLDGQKQRTQTSTLHVLQKKTKRTHEMRWMKQVERMQWEIDANPSHGSRRIGGGR